MKELQRGGVMVFPTADLSRPQREALLRAGFLRPVVKGWYMAARPGDESGDSTPWFAALRDFIGGYCESRFRTRWHLSPAYSIHVHAGATTLPQQVIVHAPQGTNNVLALPGGCSLLDYQAKDFPTADRIERLGGIRVLTLPAALSRVPEAFFHTSPTDAQIVLAQIPDASDLNRELLAGSHSVVAGRLAGALRAIDRHEVADDVVATMRAAGYVVNETNPFPAVPPTIARTRATSPYVLRLQLMWHAMRHEVLRHFPSEPGLPGDEASYLRLVQAAYRADAYHSLSIEGYQVTDELIQRVATGSWDPAEHAEDADAKAAMAAHGYWRAHAAVTISLRRILARDNAGEVVRADHGSWFREIFAPSVEAGILQPADLAGYRGSAVYIRNAAHVPPPKEAVRDMMPALFDLLAEEPSAAVRAVLGHFCFVFTHPYMDGNGRIGRFLMNAMLASGGYPWTIVRVERRAEYMAALDAASARAEIGPFAAFIASCLAATSRARPASN